MDSHQAFCTMTKYRVIFCHSIQANHTKDHSGLFYTVPKTEADKWLYNAFHAEYKKTVGIYLVSSDFICLF